MRKMLIAAVLLAGCSGDDGPQDPHEVVACEGGQAPSMCEAACATTPDPSGASGACVARIELPDGTSQTVGCDPILEFDEVTGCCIDFGEGAARAVYFAECF